MQQKEVLSGSILVSPTLKSPRPPPQSCQMLSTQFLLDQFSLEGQKSSRHRRSVQKTKHEQGKVANPPPTLGASTMLQQDMLRWVSIGAIGSSGFQVPRAV